MSKELTAFQIIENKFQYGLNIVGLISSIISVLLIISLVSFKYQILNRVTLKFQALIALLDIARHISNLGLDANDGPFCVFIGFLIYFEDHLYVFLNVMISLNVQLLYIHDICPKKIYEKIYWIAAIGLALIIDIIPITHGGYGKNEQELCTLALSLGDKRKYYKLFLVYLTVTPGVLYCFFCFLAVCYFLMTKSHQFKSRWPDKTIFLYGESVNSQDFIKKLFFRMSLYPVSCFFGLFPFLLANFLKDTLNYDNQALHFLARFGRRAVGLMNLMSLIYDPHFQLAFISMWNNSPLRKYYQFKNHNNLNPLNETVDMNMDLKTIADNESKKYHNEEVVTFPNDEIVPLKEYINFC